MTFEECRSTCLRPQALLTLVVGLAACGQERVSDPFTPVFREAADTVGVLRAVASAIVEMNARWIRLASLQTSPRIVGNAGWSVGVSKRPAGTSRRAITRPRCWRIFSVCASRHDHLRLRRVLGRHRLQLEVIGPRSAYGSRVRTWRRSRSVVGATPREAIATGLSDRGKPSRFDALIAAGRRRSPAWG